MHRGHEFNEAPVQSCTDLHRRISLCAISRKSGIAPYVSSSAPSRYATPIHQCSLTQTRARAQSVILATRPHSSAGEHSSGCVKHFGNVRKVVGPLEVPCTTGGWPAAVGKCSDSPGTGCGLERGLLHDHNPHQRSTPKSSWPWVLVGLLPNPVTGVAPPPLIVVSNKRTADRAWLK